MADLQIKLRRDVDEVGWHVLNVFALDDQPLHSYSVGLYQNYNHPEIVIVGLQSKTAHTLINDVGAQIRKGRVYASGDRSSEFLNGYDVAFISVTDALYQDYFGQAIDFYGSLEFPVLQLVWPDSKHLLPWDPGFDESLRVQQPVLSSPPAELSPN